MVFTTIGIDLAKNVLQVCREQVICPVSFYACRRLGMRRTELLQELRKTRFEEAYGVGRTAD
jgi:hypothetical protein